jgi:hypothetical protein
VPAPTVGWRILVCRLPWRPLFAPFAHCAFDM